MKETEGGYDSGAVAPRLEGTMSRRWFGHKMNFRSHKIAGICLALGLMGVVCTGTSRGAAPGATPESGESAASKAPSVHLPDEPGTVPLQEVLVETREDAEEPPHLNSWVHYAAMDFLAPHLRADYVSEFTYTHIISNKRRWKKS